VVPKWLEVDQENLKGKVVSLPEREDIDIPIQEHLIVELYSSNRINLTYGYSSVVIRMVFIQE
jgi:hypothetical protein